MKISGYTFGHNLISSGYPFIEAIEAVRPYVDEIVAADIESTDGTSEVLKKICNKVVPAAWGGRDTTPGAFFQHVCCSGDVVIFFEADEVYDDSLLKEIRFYLERGHKNLAVWRLQIEQNLQRCREYPIPVHRVFPRGGGTYHIHPTIWPDNMKTQIQIIPSTAGYLWDCSNIFQESWMRRKETQAEIWGEPRHLMVAQHFTEPNEIDEQTELANLHSEHWLWTSTPFNIPDILKPLLGKTKYEVDL